MFYGKTLVEGKMFLAVWDQKMERSMEKNYSLSKLPPTPLSACKYWNETETCLKAPNWSLRS